jgi:hypothetical protein
VKGQKKEGLSPFANNFFNRKDSHLITEVAVFYENQINSILSKNILFKT